MRSKQTLIERIKLLIFQLLYVIDSNKFKNKYILGVVQILQLLPVIYYYLNPLFAHLDGLHFIRDFHHNIWPQIIPFIPNKQAIVSVILLLTFPSIVVALIAMKLFIGYQYILIILIELFLLIYPTIFIKYTLDAVDLIIGKPQFRLVGILLLIIHLIGSLATFQLYMKKHKLIDFILIFFIYLQLNQYAIFTFIIIRLVLVYFLSQQNILKQFKINTEISLLLILSFSFLTADVLTNYISFLFILVIFSISPVFDILQHYQLYENLIPQHYDNIFYLVDQIEEEPNRFRLKFYDFIEQHLNDCQNVHCECRKILQIKDHKEFKQKAYDFLNSIYSFKQDFSARIQYAQVCSSHFSYKLSGLLHTFQNTPEGLYQQFQAYSAITSYEEQYRRGDKNHHFGLAYHTIFQDLRQFQQKIENITVILRDFWMTILEFDGSRKFLSMILSISEQINQITKLFNLYVDKYEEHSHYFLYLFKTFQLVILNSHQNSEDSQQGSLKSLGIIKTQQKIKVPSRMLFFVADEQSHIINSNREFSNFVEIDRYQLLNKSYNIFVPGYCSQQHVGWVEKWFSNCNKQIEFVETVKTMQLENSYIKSVSILTKILPRFDKGLLTISFIKLNNQLTHSTMKNHLLSLSTSTESHTQDNKEKEQQENEDFFSFLIDKQTSKIAAFDDSFYNVIKLKESQQLKKRILSLKMTDLFPKLGLIKKQTTKEKQKQSLLNEQRSFQNDLINREKEKEEKDGRNYNQSLPKQVILNYQLFEQFVEIHQHNNIGSSMMMPEISNNSFNYNNSFNNSFNSYFKSNIVKQTTEYTFLHQIIPQKNTDLQNEYCIVSFKLKHKPHSKEDKGHLHHRSQAHITSNSMVETKGRKQQQQQKQQQKQGFDDHIKQEDQNFINHQITSKGSKTSSQNSENPQGLTQKRSSSFNHTPASNLAFREPFIRSSKPYKQQKQNDQTQNQKSTKSSQSVDFSSQKSYCLPWLIILPLIIVHVLYLQVIINHNSILTYLSQTFDFYDQYEMTILREINVTIDKDVNYLGSLKQLWVQGYGFYQDSFLIFEEHASSDKYLMERLYSTVIDENHYGIYMKISESFLNQQFIISSLYLAIILTLSGFIFYILVDFILNLRYCFSISAQVTDIVLIFLNISQKDIKKLIASIDQYQQSVLQINDFTMIKEMIRRDEQSYKLDERQAEDTSAIGLLKQNTKSIDSFISLKNKAHNLDSLFQSPMRSEQSKINSNQSYIEEELIPGILAKNHQQKGRKKIRKRKTTKTQKINIDKLKECLNNLHESENEAQSSISPMRSNKTIGQKKSSFFKNNSSSSPFQSSDDELTPSFKKKPQKENIQDQITDEHLSKLQKISKFKQKFRGKLNDIKQHPHLYGILFIALLLAVIVLVLSLTIIPQFLSSLEVFQQRYFDLRAMKIIIFKQLIQKLTNRSLLPYEKPSVYGQQFYINTQETLNSLPEFQTFWENVYTNDACSLVFGEEIHSICLSIGSKTTSYGQKIMLQFLQDLLRRLNSSELFQPDENNSKTQFIKVVNLQLYMISKGEKLLQKEIQRYRKQVQSFEIIIVTVGTIILAFNLILSRKALNDILSKIKDGQNLLLVMPEKIKNKYIEEVKKKKSLQQLRQLQNEQKQKIRKARRKSSIVKNLPESKPLSQVNNGISEQSQSPQVLPQDSKTPQLQHENSGIQLIKNNSSFLNKDSQLIEKQSLKNCSQLKLKSFTNYQSQKSKKNQTTKSKFTSS